MSKPFGFATENLCPDCGSDFLVRSPFDGKRSCPSCGFVPEEDR